MPLSHKTILAIDDTASIRIFLRICLQTQGAQFLEASSAGEGLELCKEAHPDLVVLDLGLPDRDGLELISEIKTPDETGKTPRVVILSVRKEQAVREKAFSLGADAYITKPFVMDELLEVLNDQFLVK